jgi:phytoene desaturase
MTRPAVVIGSGFGGLAAAVRLRARGWPVVVLEARSQPGGRASVFHSGGFTFDAGPTVITAPYLFDELFALLGRDRRDYLEMMAVDPFYRIELWDGSRFDYVGDEERLLAQIARFEPKDVDGYRRLLREMKRIFAVAYEQLVDAPFDRVADMVSVVPELVRLGSFRSVYSMVSRYLRDERLRQVFTFQPLLIGGNPFRASSLYSMIHWLERKWGVHFAKGGTGAIVQALVRLLEESGVEVRLSSPVAEIEIEHGRAKAVRLESGERIEAELVVANADPTMVYERMIPSRFRRRHSDARLASRRQSMSLFVLYFGVGRTYPELAHHTILLGPRYRGLLEDIFEKRILAEDFSLYLHAPARTDPALAPAGSETFYVLSPVPNNASGIDWKREGARYADRILAELERRALPGLSDHLVTSFFLTPDYFQEELRSKDGAAFGLEPTLTQSAWFRFHNRSEDVGDLYFVGSGTHPGAGLPGVLSSAKVLEKLIPVREERAA